MRFRPTGGIASDAAQTQFGPIPRLYVVCRWLSQHMAQSQKGLVTHGGVLAYTEVSATGPSPLGLREPGVNGSPSLYLSGGFCSWYAVGV